MKNESTHGKTRAQKHSTKYLLHDSIRLSEREKGSGKSCCVVLFKKNKNHSTKYAKSFIIILSVSNRIDIRLLLNQEMAQVSLA